MSMTSALVIGFIAIIIVCGLTIWVTNKAYSKKWDQKDHD
jgi:hypothetical protein